MRKSQILFMGILITILMSLTACGKDDKDEIPGYYVIESQKESLAPAEMLHSDLRLLGMQYFQDEIIQLRAEKKNTEQGILVDIYICRLDGSKEMLLPDMESAYQLYNLFLCEDGGCLVYTKNGVKKVDRTGQILFDIQTNGFVQDVCQLTNGNVILLVYEEDTSKTYLQKMDVKTGEIAEIDNVYLGETVRYNTYITDGGKNVYVLNSAGVQEVNLKDKSITDIINVQGTNYKMESLISVAAFRVLQENQVEIVRGAEVETLQYVNLAESRKILYFDVLASDRILPTCVETFNKAQDVYYVAIRGSEEGESPEEYQQRLNVQLAAGDGPDIILSNSFTDPTSLIEKGVFLDISDYLEENSIREEDYFPVAFDWYREGEEIYGVNMNVQPIVYWISEDLLGSREIPTITELVDALLNYEGQAIFDNGFVESEMLSFLLDGSESLWGMIDWEAGTCAFDTELFAQILEVSKKYADDETKADYPELAGRMWLNSFYREKEDSHEQMEQDGKVIVGWLFDEGAHARYHESWAVSVNANTKYPEGALEFIRYIMTEGQRLYTRFGASSFPTSIAAYDAWFQEELAAGVIEYDYNELTGRTSIIRKRGGNDFRAMGGDVEAFRAVYDLRPEEGEQIKEILLNCRCRPTKILPIIDIIREETGAYFSGVKSVEEVIPIIENRVQLYLDEKN